MAGAHGLHWKPQLVETEMPELAWDEPAECPGMTSAVRIWGSLPSAGIAVNHNKPAGEGTTDLEAA